jgi:hypothetical protein
MAGAGGPPRPLFGTPGACLEGQLRGNLSGEEKGSRVRHALSPRRWTRIYLYEDFLKILSFKSLQAVLPDWIA